MHLRKLTDKTIFELEGKDIYFVRYFNDYLVEIYDRYPQLHYPSGIIESDPARQGIHDFRGHSFEAMSMDDFLRTAKKCDREIALIITTGYYREEYDALSVAGLPDQIGDSIYYYANRDTEYYEEHLEKYEKEPLKDLIVFRSGMGAWEHVPGMDFTENSRALFEYMQRSGYGDKYEFVWLVKAPSEYESVSHKYVNTSFVSYDWAVSEDKEQRDRYYRAICLAKYFFFTHACGFCRLPRRGQIRVQLWHGCGFKTVRNTVSQSKRYEYTTVVSRLYADIHKKEFLLDDDQLLVTGYAKEDWLFHPAGDWRTRLDIPEAGKYIFWLPTFRKATDVVSYMDPESEENETQLPLLATYAQLDEINSMLKLQDTFLIIKLHPLQKYDGKIGEQFSNVRLIRNTQLADADLHINNVLGMADALISDYSSVAIDYLLLDRPIAFTLSDLDEYENSRGFVLNPIEEWLPGYKLYSYEDLKGFVNDVTSGVDRSADIRRNLRKKLHDFGDDNSCRRILAALGI